MSASVSADVLRIAVLASGRGSNLAALHAACLTGRIEGRIVGVFSDKPDCGALRIARESGIATWSSMPKDFPSRDAFDAALFDAIEAVQPGLIVCAGYMRIIGAAAIARFPRRMLNIHPSLLPRHPGLHTHQRALDAGDAEHGASVHGVIPELDAGPVLAHVRIPIHRPGDTPSSLAERLLPEEHRLLVDCVAGIAQGRTTWEFDGFHVEGRPLCAPLDFTAGDTPCIQSLASSP